MDEATWNDVDRYIAGHLIADDPALDQAIADAEQAGLPPINVSAAQGMYLHVLVRALGARQVLELGTLAGYSTIWIGRALGAGGRVVTCEVDPRHAEVAEANLARAGLAEVVELRLGSAHDTLAKMVVDGEGPFDLVFIDADKPGYPGYLDQALALSRPGTVIVADNVIRAGAVLQDTDDPINAGIRRFTERLGELVAEGRLTATEIQTVGAKGYDGFALCLVNG